MASRRIAKSSMNWAALAERVSSNQTTSFAAFKSKSDSYLRAVLANPENAPKIDWAYYKRLIPNAAMVDAFEKQYESIKVPYPTDTVSSQVESQVKEVQDEINSYKKLSETRIKSYETQIGHLKSLLPYDQMTMEDFQDSFPEKALDPLNHPTFWPHTEEEQLGYKSKEQMAAEH